jgi:hypothetical protein
MPETNSPSLSPSQKRIIAAGATALALMLLIATACSLFVVLQMFILTFKDVLLPLAIAAILATLLRPIITLCEKHTRLSKTQGIILLYLLVLLAIATITLLLLPILLRQVTEFIEAVPSIRDNFYQFLQEKAPAAWQWLHAKLGQAPDAYVQNIVATHSETITSALQALPEKISMIGGSVGGFIGSMFAKIAAYAIIPIYLFFILNVTATCGTICKRSSASCLMSVDMTSSFSAVSLARYSSHFSVGKSLSACSSASCWRSALRWSASSSASSWASCLAYSTSFPTSAPCSAYLACFHSPIFKTMAAPV